jgi:hypothetical protein
MQVMTLVKSTIVTLSMITRTYSELILIPTFEERFDYLSLKGVVGAETFGHDRHVNQQFYKSAAWRNIRDYVIVRDNGCDLAVEGHDIYRGTLIHHIIPMGPRDILESNPLCLDPENLITTIHDTHNAIHYGDRNLLPRAPTVRRPGDTKRW